MKTSIPVLRSVTDKASGRTIRVLRHLVKNDRNAIDKRISDLMDRFFSYQIGAGGFAFVIWDKEGASMTALSSFNGSAIPRALLPEYVKGTLLLNIASDW